jgi:hypothetical protein
VHGGESASRDASRGVDERGTLLIHCLDTEQPVAAQFTEDEAMLMTAAGAA